MIEHKESGEILSETMPTLLHRLHRKEETGRLLCQKAGVTKTLQVERGAVVFAASTHRDDRLIQLLLKRGTVSLPHLMSALEASLKNKQRLGEVLLSQNRIMRDELDRTLQDQLKEIVCSVFNWDSGSWAFEKGPPSEEKVTLTLHPLALILEGIRRIESWARVYEKVGGMNAEYRATREAPDLAHKADLLPGERQILNFTEESRTLSEICEVVRLNDFVVCKVVWGLLIIGALMKA
ncbi:MAG TPA: DUF4388 domain-containing protein [Candidatus Polarisedimenticolia bacterium]|nr:DUF4388 domain-containing protein [Candidatus Polarisedimenticolia bacterium]